MENKITKTDKTLIADSTYKQLLSEIGQVIAEGRKQVLKAVNTTMLQMYWSIGRHIVEYEQNGELRAQYGRSLLSSISKDLTEQYGTGFNRNNLQYMRKLYLAFPNCTTLSCKLSWSHYIEILKSDDPLEISFYIRQCEEEQWSVRALKRQMDSMLFQRLALSKDKEGVLQLAKEGHVFNKPEDLLHDPYVLEFLQMPEQNKYKEDELEQKICENMKDFLLEMGKGFAFIKSQYHIALAGRHFHCDLVFYHCILKCYVLIDLKRGEIQHEDIGQMNLYLNYFKHEVCQSDDNPPVGIILGAKKDEIVMEYALEGITNNLFAARYQLYLPKREDFQAQMDHILQQEEKENDIVEGINEGVNEGVNEGINLR